MPTDATGNAKIERKLVAILAADIAGYSALMGADDEATVRDLKAHQSVILPMITEHGGRVIDTAGDGILAEFASVLSAVKCALAIQKTMAERNAAADPARRMQFRIGINQGDVVFDDARVYGDGVNIAARLESIADPGSVLISGKVHDEVRGKLDLRFEDLGRQALKNIVDPVPTYRVRGYEAMMPLQNLALPDKPSIAVLSFTNMSGDPDQEFFGDGIAEDVSTELSKLRWLFVIARNSSFTYKGRAIDIKQVSRELGVRYVLEGSVRRAGARARVTAQLIDATTGAHVWADRFDRDLTDIFAVQDEITTAVARAIGPVIVDAERQRAVRKPPESLGAWEAYQRGMWHQSRANPADAELARRFFQRAIDLDPTFVAAHGELAGTITTSAVMHHTMNLDAAVSLAEPLARKALALDANDPISRVALGVAMYIKGDIEGAISEYDRGLALDPNSARALGLKGAALMFLGNYVDGREALSKSVRLSPRDSYLPTRLTNLAAVQYFEKDYAEAAETARQTLRQFPGNTPSYRWLIASLGQLGKESEAAAVMAIAPPAYDHFARQRPPWMRSVEHEHMLEGLRKAGWHD